MGSPGKQSSAHSALKALTSAALVLPGLLETSGLAAESDSVGVQYSRYEEGERDLFNVKNSMDPLQVDTFRLNGDIGLTDRLRFGFNFIEDVWSGATPVATAPLAAGSNRPIREGDTIVGASPMLNRPVLLDADLNPLQLDPLTGEVLGVESRSVHVLATASPEARRQGDFNLEYEWDNAALAINGGLSVERDYESAFGGLSGRWDFNQKLTTLKGGVSYTDSDITAVLDSDAAPYITQVDFQDQISFKSGSEILREERSDFAANLGLTQVVTKYSLIDINLGFTHSSGYLENPYKAVSVIFVDPDQPSGSVLSGDVRALMENRPGERNQGTVGVKWVQHIKPLDAALHFDYQFSRDDWGISAHTFEADWVQPLGGGWTIAPRIRYYSQNDAAFYRPYLFSFQRFSEIARDDRGREVWVDDRGREFFRDENFDLVDADGNVVDENAVNARPKIQSFDRDQLPDHFSSDHRLSGFGTLSGGITVSKVFAPGVTLEAGFEYYSHAGSLKLGGGGEDAFADFNYFVADATLTVDLESLDFGMPADQSAHQHHHHHANHLVPAGLMYAHMMPSSTPFMVGYRFNYSRRDGPQKLLHGSNTASDRTVVAEGCRDIGCRFAPTYMDMYMHMVEIMYAPTDWLNLMLMPQFMSMEMNLRELDGRPPPVPEVHEHTGIVGHTTGGVGDTIMASMIRLFDLPGHHMHVGLGISAPTGAVDLEFRRIAQQDGGLEHFGMQLGSGTWDFLPSLTYTGHHERWSWGAQVRGTVRLQDENESGYRLGNVFQSTVWGGYGMTDWLQLSVRGVYTAQGKIVGDFNAYNGRAGPMDFPSNYGGYYWDVGFGVNALIPKGWPLAGNTLRFEWLQPLQDDVNGFQLKREGALTASWNYAF
ncbi:MAG: DUF3570 domain-containing protein [Methylohalobius sp. ZOD2]